MLGKRETSIYGSQTLEDLKNFCATEAEKLNLYLDFRQSNYEGQLIDWIHEAHEKSAGLIINAAAYTHTSIAIHDALKILTIPIIEVHLSNPKTREEFRHFSFVESLAKAHFAGHGFGSYAKALQTMAEFVG
jgi:3-dehydroquinate dehydratase II